jgi:hypothetical protein
MFRGPRGFASASPPLLANLPVFGAAYQHDAELEYGSVRTPACLASTRLGILTKRNILSTRLFTPRPQVAKHMRTRDATSRPRRMLNRPRFRLRYAAPTTSHQVGTCAAMAPYTR